MLGYGPDQTSLQEEKGEHNHHYYYWPFFMNGKVMLSSLFDSMIMWTQDEYNHLETMKKLVNNSLFQNHKNMK